MKRVKTIITTLFVAGLAWAATPAHADEPLSLVYAVYDNQNGAMDAFKSLQEAQREQIVRIQAFAVISRDASGRVRVQNSNQRRGTVAGVVLGGIIGAIGGPPGVVLGAAAGGAVGHATGSAAGIPREDINAIKDTLPAGSSALIAVLDERWSADLSRSLQQTEARRVLNSKIQAGTSAQPSPVQPGAQPQPGTQQP